MVRKILGTFLSFLLAVLCATPFLYPEKLFHPPPEKVILEAPPPIPVEQEVIKIKYPEPPKSFDTKLKLFIISQCNENGVPYLLVFKLIEKESQWDMYSKGYNLDSKGQVLSIDYGLMQINSANLAIFPVLYRDEERLASSYNIKSNPYDNAEVGIKHLKDLYTQFHSWQDAVAAYNGGSYRVLRGKVRESTKNYVLYICPVDLWWEFPSNVLVERSAL